MFKKYGARPAHCAARRGAMKKIFRATKKFFESQRCASSRSTACGTSCAPSSRRRGASSPVVAGRAMCFNG